MLRALIAALTASRRESRRKQQSTLLVLALSFAFPLTQAKGGQIFVPFSVSVRVGGEINSSGICSRHSDPSAFGAIVNIVCATGVFAGIEAPRNAVAWTPVHGGAYRFTRISPDEIRAVQYVQSSGSYTGVGTVTSWRVVSVADREYLEMLVDW